MTKSTIAVGAALLIGVSTIAVLAFRNSQLKEEAEAVRSAHPRAEKSPRLSPRPSGPEARGVDSESERLAKKRDLSQLLADPDPMNRMRLLLEYADNMAVSEIPGALAEIWLGAPDWDPDAKALIHLLAMRWAEQDPDAALSALDSGDYKQLGAEPTSILAGLAASDPNRAAAWLETPENSLMNYPVMGHILAGTVAKEWVRQDPDAALAWASGLPDNQRAGAYSGVLGTLAGTDPKLASSLALQLEPGKAREHVVGEIAKSWVRRSPAEALEWAQALNGEERSAAMREGLQVWSNAAPAETAAYLDRIAESESIDSYLDPVARSWAAEAPQEAIQWLARQEDGDGRNRAMGAAMWNWGKQNPEAAAEWLREQPEGPSRDGAVAGFAKARFDEDPDYALRWAITMSNDDLRTLSVNIGLRVWMERDAEAAQAWAGTNGVVLPVDPRPANQ